MSNSFEKESQEFTGLNLQIYKIATRTASTRMVDGQFHNTEEVVQRLAKILKKLISEAVAEVKQISQAYIDSQVAKNEVVRAMPLSFHGPEDNDAIIVQPTDQRRRHRAVQVGEIQKSFEIPNEYVLYCFEQDKLPMPPYLREQIKQEAQHEVVPKFFDRLVGWKLQCKQRVDGRLDTYFHHVKSHEAFRSNIEVVQFILHGICPRHLKKGTITPKENFSGCGDGGQSKMSSTSLRSPSSSGGILTEEEEKLVEKFFAYNRLSSTSVNENSPQSFQTYNGEQSNNTGVSVPSSEAMEENYFLLENVDGKRKRREDSPLETSRREEKCMASSSSPVPVTPPPAIPNVGVEVLDKPVSVSEPATVPEPVVNPIPTPTVGRSDVEPITIGPLEYFDTDYIFDQLVTKPKSPDHNFQYDIQPCLDELNQKGFGDDFSF